MNYRYIITNNKTCIPVEEIRNDSTIYDHQLDQTTKKVSFGVNTYKSGYVDFPSGNSFIFDCLDMSIKSIDINILYVEMKEDGLVWVECSIKSTKNKLEQSQYPTFIEWIRDIKLNKLGI